MPRFENPGAMFLGTLVSSEQKFLKVLLQTARASGYTRVVEPCSGALAMSHLAVQVGYKGEQLEASDVSLFSSILGYACMGKTLEELEIHADGFTDEELCNPAVALYAQVYLRNAKSAGKEYFHNLLMDMEYRRDEHIKHIQDQLDRGHQLLKGISYRPLDMWKHLAEVKDDEKTVIIANPPTYTAGFEKWYDTNGRVTWKEPDYQIFDAKTGLFDLYDYMKDAKALLLCYEENEPGKTAGAPVFARYGVRNGINVYLTSNRPDEATQLAHGKMVVRPNEEKLEPLKCAMLPRDYTITTESKVQLCKIERTNAQYYRKLWTHNFTGSSAPINVAILIDGMIAGVMGLDKAALTMGAFGTRVSDSVFLMYGMTVPHKVYRLGRLVTMLAQNKPFIMGLCTDIEKEKAKSLKTVQMTKYPEAKEMRGVMKLVERNPDKQKGYRLTYKSDLKDRTEEQTLKEWLKKEEVWRTERQKTKQQSTK